jgi:hypothetical protein
MLVMFRNTNSVYNDKKIKSISETFGKVSSNLAGYIYIYHFSLKSSGCHVSQVNLLQMSRCGVDEEQSRRIHSGQLFSLGLGVWLQLLAIKLLLCTYKKYL